MHWHLYCVNEPFYGSSKLTNPPPITATFDVVSGLLDSILVYFLKKRKKFLCRTSELGYTLQVSQVSRQLQKSGCDVTSYKTTVGVLLILKFSDFLTCISFNCTFHWQWLFYLYVRSRVTSRLSEMKQNHG